MGLLRRLLIGEPGSDSEDTSDSSEETRSITEWEDR